MALEIPQVTFNNRPPKAFAGMLADNGNHNVLSAIAENAMDAGLGVVQGTTGGDTPQVDLPANTGEVAKFKGVTLYTALKEPNGASAARYAAKEAVPVLSQGRIWVQVDGTVGAELTEESAVYLVHSGAQAGKFRQDTGAGGTAATLVASAVCRLGGAASGIALVEFNRP